jgi:hypothetical protein
MFRYPLLCQMLRKRSPGRDDAILSTWQVLQITVPLRKTHCSPYKFKIAGLVEKMDDLGHFWA